MNEIVNRSERRKVRADESKRGQRLHATRARIEGQGVAPASGGVDRHRAHRPWATFSRPRLRRATVLLLFHESAGIFRVIFSANGQRPTTNDRADD